MFRSIIIFISVLIFFVPAALVSGEELFNGDVYLQGTNKGVLLFRQKNYRTVSGSITILKHIYNRPDGSLAALEEVVYDKKGLRSYMVELTYGDCGCTLTRTGDKVEFGFTRGDKNKKGDAPNYKNMVMGPTLHDYVKKNWSDLQAGKKVYFMLPAMSLQRVAKFYLQKNKKSKYNRPGVVVIKMNISNVFFRAFVSPVDLVYDMKTKRILEIHGKSLLQRKVKGKIENPVVDIYYRYDR